MTFRYLYNWKFLSITICEFHRTGPMYRTFLYYSCYEILSIARSFLYMTLFLRCQILVHV